MTQLKILMILDAPWTRELGASQCSIELAEEFRALGHHVDKFDLRDAFPRQTKLGSFFEASLFARRAVAFVRRHGSEYDVVQAAQGNLPVSRAELGYDGVLACRSDGLVHFYDEWLRERRHHGEDRIEPRGTAVGDVLRKLAVRMHGGVDAVNRSFESADVIVLLNREELGFVVDRLGHDGRAVLLPNGLSEARLLELASAAHPPETRLREQHVVFVGHLSARKGLEDFPLLVRELRERIPAVRFSLLGTALRRDRVLSLFAEEDRARIQVIERFAPEDLPRLLADGTAGVLPSYLEGFPLGVLELLAARIPTIAYDVPGSRELVGQLGNSALTSAGDPASMAAEHARVLSLPVTEYEALAARARVVAERFRWRDIARQTLAVYESAREARTMREAARPTGRSRT
jgi:glycosyltransferase involved in cell wall biosynthesis